MAGSKNGPKHRGEDGYYDEHNHWWPFTPMLPSHQRQMPETVPNEYLVRHAVDCRCSPCQRYPNLRALRESKIRYAARRRSSRRREGSRPRGA